MIKKGSYFISFKSDIYITENVEKLKLDNTNQIEVADRFKIWNLWVLNSIIVWLWLKELLGWKLVNLSVEKFKEIIKKTNELESSWEEINWKKIFNICNEVWVKNPQHFHTWLSAIWITKKYWKNKIIITNRISVQKILNYIESRYWDSKVAHTFRMNEVQDIINETKELLPKEHTMQVRAIKSVLVFFDYIVDEFDISQSNSIKKPVEIARPVFFN